MAELAARFGLSIMALTRGPAEPALGRRGLVRPPGAAGRGSDTIGAGDAFTAALVVGRLAGRALDEINRHASEVAAFVCSQPRTRPCPRS